MPQIGDLPVAVLQHVLLSATAHESPHSASPSAPTTAQNTDRLTASRDQRVGVGICGCHHGLSSYAALSCWGRSIVLHRLTKMFPPPPITGHDYPSPPRTLLRIAFR